MGNKRNLEEWKTSLKKAEALVENVMTQLDISKDQCKSCNIQKYAYWDEWLLYKQLSTSVAKLNNSMKLIRQWSVNGVAPQESVSETVIEEGEDVLAVCADHE